MARLLSSRSVKGKLITVIMFISIAVVFLVTAASILFEWSMSRTRMVNELQVLAEMIGETCASSLTFNEAEDAKDVLNSLQAKASIESACLFRNGGTPLATYHRQGTSPTGQCRLGKEDSYEFVGGNLVLSRTIVVGGQRQGSLTLQSDQSELWAVVRQKIVIASVLLLLSVVVAYSLAFHLQRTISGPILSLATTARSITSCKDFSLRADKHADDEIGLLTDTFNEMLADIESSDAALRRTYEKYRRLADNLVGTFLYRRDTEGIFNYVSSSVGPVLGYSIGEVLTHFTKFLTAHPINSKAKALLDLANRGAQQSPFEVQVFHRDGAVRWLEVSEVPVRDDSGEVVVVEGVAHDITLRKHAEEELVRLATVVEQAAEEIVITDTSGGIVYVNPAFERITGYSKEEVTGGRQSMLAGSQHDQKYYDEIWTRIKAGETWKGRIRNQRKDGALIHEEATISPIKESNTQIVGYVAVKRDMTDQYIMEEQLRQAQKMEAIGTLAGGIAHDFNNILSAILGYSELLREDLSEEQSPSVPNVDEILRAVERARDLVQQILAFSRRSAKERLPISIAPVVKEALKLLRSALPATTEIHTQITGDRDTVLADHTQIHQVVMNLCTNAWHAMRTTGGVLEVKLEPVELDSESVAISPDLEPGPYLKLTVKDSGCGIEKAHLDRVFDPFFTTKDKGEGTGMGLAVVHGIVKSHGGAVTIDSEPGRGTEVCIYLPRLLSEVEIQKKPEEQRPRGDEKLLIVDDEEAIRNLMSRMLHSLGYTVTTCDSGNNALQVFGTNPNAFDMVITDLAMPGITGIVLAGKLLKLRPEIPVIIATGFSDTLSPDQVRVAGIREMVMKPLRFDDLATVVRRVLDASYLSTY
jgi:PAS domain S-box-containing protein